MSQTSVVTLKGTLLNSVFYSFHVNWKRFTTFSLLIEPVGNKTGFMLINSTCVEKYQQGSHALVWIDHSTRPEDSGCSSPDLSPASLFLPPYFNKTLIIFPQLCFSPFCFRPPPSSPCISAWLCQERDMRWHQNPEAVEAWGFFSTVTIELLPWLERLS